MLKVVHIVPYDGIGGVENAARSALKEVTDDISFRLLYIVGEPLVPNELVISSSYHSKNNPQAHIIALAKLLRLNPDIVVCSLWRTVFIGVMYKILRPRKKLVCFLHSASTVHFLDRLLNYLLMAFSSAIWADSQSTLQKRVPRILKKKSHYIVSFVTEHLAAEPFHAPRPVFMFWGRLHRQKGVDRALELFKLITARYPNGRFYIFGPDGGELKSLRSQVHEMDLVRNVSFEGPVSIQTIVEAAKATSFYLQLSRTEGMAMSVVEAMQLGLVPVVAPVGGIEHYCKGGGNSIIYQSGEKMKVVDAISELIDEPGLYSKMREASIKQWEHAPLYRTDFFNAIRDLSLP